MERALRASEQIRDIVRDMSRITKLELLRQASNLPAVLDIRKSSDPGLNAPEGLAVRPPLGLRSGRRLQDSSRSPTRARSPRGRSSRSDQ